MSQLAAKRWAKALIELSKEDDGISREEILDDLREVLENLSASKELSDVINNPSISVDEKQIVLSKLFQNKIIPIVYNFLFALNLKKRLDILEEITDEFRKEMEILNNILRVKVTSAVDINEDKKMEIRNRIAEMLQKDVRVSWGVDTDIIAGLIFNINDTVIDNSIKHKLDKLSDIIIRGNA